MSYMITIDHDNNKTEIVDYLDDEEGVLKRMEELMIENKGKTITALVPFAWRYQSKG